MITVLTGDNSYAIDQELALLSREFDGNAEIVDASELDVRSLPDMLMGGTLFASQRLIVLKHLSDNKSLWTEFEKWIPRIADTTHIVIADTKIDKRTKTYKELQKFADVRTYATWHERDGGLAEHWVAMMFEQRGRTVSKKVVHQLVQRVGVDQWALSHAIEKLLLLDDINEDVVPRYIDAQPTDNVFNLLDAALHGDRAQVSAMIRNLEVAEDPYQVFGLITSQVFQLAAVVAADPNSDISKDIGVHPYVLSKLKAVAKQKNRGAMRKIVNILADVDDDMKLSRAEPWLLIERALLKVASL